MRRVERVFASVCLGLLGIACSIEITGRGELDVCVRNADCPTGHCGNGICQNGGAGSSSGTAGSTSSGGSASAGEGGAGNDGSSGQAGEGSSGEAGSQASGAGGDMNAAGEGGSSTTGGLGGLGGAAGGSGAPSGDECLHVAPDGSDEDAVVSEGATPFATVQAAIAFAATHPAAPRSICVAAGPECGQSFDYVDGRGNLQLTSELSIYGKYESTSFTRCSASTTRLQPKQLGGVRIAGTLQARLDGFAIRSNPRWTGPAIVTIDLASGVELRDLTIEDYESGRSTGIHVTDAEASVTESTIVLQNGLDVSIGIIAERSRMAISKTTVDVASSYVARGMTFDHCADSSISENTVATVVPPGSGLTLGIGVSGNSSNVRVFANNVTTYGGTQAGGIGVGNCASTAPEVAHNTIRVTNPSSGSEQNTDTGITVSGFCPAVIQGNLVHTASGNGHWPVGIACIAFSECSILDNDVSVSVLATQAGTVNAGTGIDCFDCAEISRNQVSGIVSLVPCAGPCDFDSIGISARGSGTLIDANRVDGGCSGGPIGGQGSAGIRVNGSIRVQNNVVYGGHECPTPVGAALTSGILIIGDSPDVHSNFIEGGQPSTSICTSAGVRFTGAPNQATLRNNIILAGGCVSDGAPVQVSDPSYYPLLIENNDLLPNSSGVLYRDVVFNRYSSLAELETITAFPFRASFSADCPLPLTFDSPCVDAGTPTGAPERDRDGEAREQGFPDVGPDEWIERAPRSLCDAAGAGAGWRAALAFGRDWVRFDNPKFDQFGFDDAAFGPALASHPALFPPYPGAPSEVLIGSAYQSVQSFDELLFVDLENFGNWVALRGLGVTQSLFELLRGIPEAGVDNQPARRLRVPIGPWQVTRGGSWDFGNPEGALMFNACRGQDPTYSVQDECGKIGPQFTTWPEEDGDPAGEPDKRLTWHALGEMWDDDSMDNESRLAYFIGPADEPSIERTHRPTLVCVR
jgi:hypothetical protein